MISIKIKKQENLIKEVDLLGHALYDDYGKDIVCAGVSAILTTTVNAALKINIKSLTYHQKKDAFQMIIISEDETTQQLVQNMIDLLAELANNYPKNIKMESEEWT
ncbi:MAG: ribosomal-processing cysteine protease Prp [Bacilli bacterium]|nr:ribosomal-processing cysteine protease Prp [Bacilli bacterium]